MIVNRSSHNCSLIINNTEKKSKKSVRLLGIKIDNKLNFEKQSSRKKRCLKKVSFKISQNFFIEHLWWLLLNFEEHVSNICGKANNQPNAIIRIGALLEQKGKEIPINTFAWSNLN